MMDWFKKHADTVIVLGAILSSVFWMNNQFFSVNSRFHEIEKDIAIIKTVLIMKNIYPADLSVVDEKERNEKIVGN